MKAGIYMPIGILWTNAPFLPSLAPFPSLLPPLFSSLARSPPPTPLIPRPLPPPPPPPPQPGDAACQAVRAQKTALRFVLDLGNGPTGREGILFCVFRFVSRAKSEAPPSRAPSLALSWSLSPLSHSPPCLSPLSRSPSRPLSVSLHLAPSHSLPPSPSLPPSLPLSLTTLDGMM